MTTPGPHGNFLEKTDEQLRQVIVGNEPGSPPYEKALFLLQGRDLTKQSRQLAFASWALTVATLILAGATLVQAYVVLVP